MRKARFTRALRLEHRERRAYAHDAHEILNHIAEKGIRGEVRCMEKLEMPFCSIVHKMDQ